MKNTLADLNNILFEQLERLMDDETMNDPESFAREIKRSENIARISSVIVSSGTLSLRAHQFASEYNEQMSVPLLRENSHGQA